MCLGIVLHLLDLVLGQAARAGDLDVLTRTGRLVGRRDAEDAVRIDREFDFDLRHASRCGCDTGEIESTERSVVVGEFTFPLEDMNRHRGLIVGSGGEGLLLAGRNGGVLFDQCRHHPTKGFDAQ